LRPWEERPPQYGASMRMLVGVLPLAETELTNYDPRYYAWLVSEYLVDDFTEVVSSRLFAENVNQRLAAQQAGGEGSGGGDDEALAFSLPAGTIQGSSVTSRQHRILTLNLTWGDADQLAALANAAAEELEENAHAYFQQLGTDRAEVTLLDAPVIYTIGPSLRERLEWPMRIGLALIVGIAIAFLIEYLDTSVRNRQDLEELGLVILGEIPKKR
jgi:capsular polysaccharide biosynthesis protein